MKCSRNTNRHTKYRQGYRRVQRETKSLRRQFLQMKHHASNTTFSLADRSQIIEISASDGTDVNGGDCLLRGHSRDQLWGLAAHPAKVRSTHVLRTQVVYSLVFVLPHVGIDSQLARQIDNIHIQCYSLWPLTRYTANQRDPLVRNLVLFESSLSPGHHLDNTGRGCNLQ